MPNDTIPVTFVTFMQPSVRVPVLSTPKTVRDAIFSIGPKNARPMGKNIYFNVSSNITKKGVWQYSEMPFCITGFQYEIFE
jgi:hypothetical protein